MGMYANYNDVWHPTAAWELADECTACGNTGWVSFPVTVWEDEFDVCPYGCADADDLEDRQWDPLTEDERAQLDALLDVEHPALEDELQRLYDQARWETEVVQDPFLTLSQQRHLKKVVGRHWGEQHVKFSNHRGMISSDHAMWGTIDGRNCKVPPYLAGTLIEADRWEAVVRYEYMGSFVDVSFPREMLTIAFRFAYSWDRSFRTSDVIG